MHAIQKQRQPTRAARAAAWLLAVCAALLPARTSTHAQQAAPLPVLTVPTGAPPATQPSSATIEEAVAAALKAAGVTAPDAGAATAAPAGEQPRTNPFATVLAQPAAGGA